MSIPGSPWVSQSAITRPTPPPWVSQIASANQAPRTTGDSPSSGMPSGVNENIPWSVWSIRVAASAGMSRRASSQANVKCSGCHGRTEGRSSSSPCGLTVAAPAGLTVPWRRMSPGSTSSGRCSYEPTP